ncbi:helix-turn-helix domain-containing protein [Candidatus Halobonum tyrrellensis]|uniref:DNA binding domain-containing protein n=1 Tax=Candidatus Halobonum tyrrellensis G22 TaxID=1324957 RepID=V4HGL7_9EURY|nr:helix-turn-helix domain-containing protein [Candidatus Halobonum tyrrellensis]ESP86949.1 DNA binding domain-containing protein [Candidatus Halobonum tyrrellensis G22]
MATIVRGTVPANEFALAHSLETIPDLEFDIERIVDSGEDAVMPMLWVRGASADRIEEVFEDDSSVQNVMVLAEFDDESLLRMEWVDNIKLLLQMLTNSEATILDAIGRERRWQFRVFYPERKLFSKTHDFCDQHGLTFEVDSVRQMDGEPAGRYGLTTEQYEALVKATRRGYFSVPREITLEELAEEMGVSHQALSERIRRGTEALVDDTLFIGFADDD